MYRDPQRKFSIKTEAGETKIRFGGVKWTDGGKMVEFRSGRFVQFWQFWFVQFRLPSQKIKFFLENDSKIKMKFGLLNILVRGGISTNFLITKFSCLGSNRSNLGTVIHYHTTHTGSGNDLKVLKDVDVYLHLQIYMSDVSND